jgi:hypothetical protein
LSRNYNVTTNQLYVDVPVSGGWQRTYVSGNAYVNFYNPYGYYNPQDNTSVSQGRGAGGDV